MADEKAIYESGISPLKVGDVLQGGEDDFIQVLAPSEKTNKYWCIHLDGSGFMEFDRALMFKFGWRLVEGAPTIAQLLEAANPHTQTALNTLREAVPGEYRSVTGMVDYAREAIEERDAIKAAISDVDGRGRSLPEKVQSIKITWWAFKEMISDCHDMLEGAGLEPAPLNDMVGSVLERLDEQPCDGPELQILDKIIGMFKENQDALGMAKNAIVDGRYIANHVANVVARCINMTAEFNRLRDHLDDQAGYTRMMDQAIEAIEFKRKFMTPPEPMVILPDPSQTQVDVVRCLMGLEPGASAGDIIAAWAERNPESAYQQGRADAYRDIAKGGEQ